MSLLGIYHQIANAQDVQTAGIKNIGIEHAVIHQGQGYSAVPTTALSLSLNNARTHFIVLHQTSAVTETVHWKENFFITNGFDVKIELLEGINYAGTYTGTITLAAATCELNAGDFTVSLDSTAVSVTVSTVQSLVDIASTLATKLDALAGYLSTYAAGGIVTVERTSDKDYAVMTLTHTASCTGVGAALAIEASTDDLVEFTLLNRDRRSTNESNLIIGYTSSSVTADSVWNANTQILERFWITGSSCYGVGNNAQGGTGDSASFAAEWILKSTTHYAWAITNVGTSCKIVPWFFWYNEPAE